MMDLAQACACFAWSCCHVGTRGARVRGSCTFFQCCFRSGSQLQPHVPLIWELGYFMLLTSPLFLIYELFGLMNILVSRGWYGCFGRMEKRRCTLSSAVRKGSLRLCLSWCCRAEFKSPPGLSFFSRHIALMLVLRETYNIQYARLVAESYKCKRSTKVCISRTKWLGFYYRRCLVRRTPPFYELHYRSRRICLNRSRYIVLWIGQLLPAQ